VISVGLILSWFIWNFFGTSKKLSLIFFAMNANKFSSEYLKNAMNAKIQKIIIAKTNQTHFALELLKVENAHKAKTTHTAKMINCMKLIVNPITEIATPEKNHFCIC
jgi:hypothetical protein